MALRGQRIETYTYDLVREVFVELFCAPRSSLENPNLRAGTQGRSFCIMEDGEMDGVAGYWVEDDESGEVGFLPEMEDVFWTFDDDANAWLSRHFRGRRLRRGNPKGGGRGRGRGGRRRFTTKKKGKGKGDSHAHWGQEESETAAWTKGKGKGKKGKSKGKTPMLEDSSQKGKGQTGKGKGKSYVAEYDASQVTPAPGQASQTYAATSWDETSWDENGWYGTFFVQEVESAHAEHHDVHWGSHSATRSSGVLLT
jgi:hypothetical protein